MTVQHDDRTCIHEALFELMKLQECIQYSSIPYFGKLLARLIEVDTIPFLLLTKNGFFEQVGIEEKGKEKFFTTKFFRIEDVDKEKNCVKVSLLRPLNLYGEDATELCDVVRLRKTSICMEIDLACICGIQCVELDLLKREFIIEPKW